MNADEALGEIGDRVKGDNIQDVPSGEILAIRPNRLVDLDESEKIRNVQNRRHEKKHDDAKKQKHFPEIVAVFAVLAGRKNWAQHDAESLLKIDREAKDTFAEDITGTDDFDGNLVILHVVEEVTEENRDQQEEVIDGKIKGFFQKETN